jgi:hypothetical protein
MRMRELATELRLCRLRHIYRQLSPAGQDTLARGAQSLSVGQRPPRLWVFVDGDGRLIRIETSANET